VVTLPLHRHARSMPPGPDPMPDNRQSMSLLEVILCLVLLGVTITPAFTTLSRQSDAGRYTSERLMAIQLANDVLELYSIKGYFWIRGQLQAYGLPISRPFGSGSASDALFTSETSPTAPGTSLNPVLGGPNLGDPGYSAAGSPPYQYSLEVNTGGTPTPNNRTRTTYETTFLFRRKVEIFLGDSQKLPLPWVKCQTPGCPAPTTPCSCPDNTPSGCCSHIPCVNCFLVRVTVWTQGGGTMPSPNRAYQVVTVVGYHAP